MTQFQWIAIAVIAVFLVVVAAAWRRQRIGRLTAFGWGAFWTAAALAIARPDAVTAIARAVSIARGADLVFYVYILVSSAATFLLVLRIRRMDRTITRLIREIALRDGGREKPQGREPG